jgi:CRP-like cAMP-binding protein
MPVHLSLLQQFSLLRHLSDPHQRQLAEQSSLGSFARREVVAEKHAELRNLGFLLEGRLQVVDFTLDGREVGLAFIEEGTCYGEVAMLDGLPHPEFVIATRKSQVVLVPARALRSMVLEEPRLAGAILLNLAARVRQQAAQRQLLSITNPLQRVSAQILLLVDGSGPERTTRGQSEYANMPLAPTHQELAIMVNLSRETVTRVFQVLQARRVLDRDGESMLIDLTRLEELARRGE